MAPGKSVAVVGVVLGDSIAAAATSGNADWATRANRNAGWLVSTFHNEGVGGETTAQVLARVGDATAHRPDVTIVACGGNDIANGVSSATTISNLEAIYDELVAAGSDVIATTVCPSTSFDTTAEQTAFDEVNAWLRNTAANMTGVSLCDWDTTIRDTPNYTWKSGYDSDGVHPNATGAAAMATVLDDTLAAVL